MGNLLLLLYPWLFSITLRCYLQQNIKVKILKYISSCHRSMGYENPVKKKSYQSINVKTLILKQLR